MVNPLEPLMPAAPAEKPIKKLYGMHKTETFMPPETMGKMKGPSPIDMSIDELIEYRMTGHKPKRILDVDVILSLAKSGVSIKNICEIFNITQETFCNNSAFLSAHREGRSLCGASVRAMIYQHAQNGSIDAAKYLDKILGGDIVEEKVNFSFSNRPLENLATENLLEIVFEEPKDGQDT